MPVPILFASPTNMRIMYLPKFERYTARSPSMDESRTAAVLPASCAMFSCKHTPPSDKVTLYSITFFTDYCKSANYTKMPEPEVKFSQYGNFRKSYKTPPVRHLSAARGVSLLFEKFAFQQYECGKTGKHQCQSDRKPCVRHRQIHRVYAVEREDDVRYLQHDRYDSQGFHNAVHVV